ncbi:guanylate kinase [Pseudoflavonifractor sp. 524-17]|uniref:guanylate kinase n=1 Tax=Pseudoflavonifractor sp. 524-17 TaxID=2304577 RepID=UPI0013798513|nr:guanylate kinase [Pseudoflavonifractor sp. 524-17]NCE64609.1 guanylate kinase [Pseudoflavonifractor sp. 524-17]
MIRKKKTQGQLIVLSGPSGVGKSTVIAELLSERDDIYFSVSFTTRQPRVGEADGVNYNFVSRETFEGMIERGELLEYAKYVGNYYGTSLKIIQDKLKAGIDVLLDIEVQGAAKVRAKCPEAVLIFIIPPTFEELSRRLHRRATDQEEVIQDRLQKAREEYVQIPNYDFMVVNDKVSDAAAEIIAILTAESCRIRNRIHLVSDVSPNTALERNEKEIVAL